MVSMSAILPPMDVERTVEFILKSQAKTETRLTGITKLMQQGMKMLVKVETNLVELSQAQKELSGAQKRTEVKVAELAGEMKGLAKAQKQTERALRAFILGQHNGRKNSGQ
jgi:hypothetical protein